MNHYIVQQNTFISREETKGFASISDLKDPIVCPKPRRLAILANNHIKQPLRWHQTEFCDSKAGADLLDIILKKGSEQSSSHVASSPPYFSGSPPSRASNPLIQDARFGDERVSPMAALPAYSPSGLSSPSSASLKGGCARMKFGLKPAAVRVEGFDCLSRDRQNSRIPAVA
ncbi:uncharacterized protein LOC111482209 [Cucurbita maxima]|uniref:Uncharacterized protein LOC111482209 n=1 Tax=Cucurbita maxima TaxID=3661 RepID=A0A6J1J8C6_CUCMA|nr:uncharacterized protein LOC111482209 [Cucurbita maxima]